MKHDLQEIGRFRLVRTLGAGSMGVVYEAEDLDHERRVALKALRHVSADMLYRLKREFRALAEIRHPNLVALHELVVGEIPFFTMDLVLGVDLLTYVRSREGSDAAYDEVRLRDAMRQLARGIAALHEARKIHRDVKPSNVLVTADGRVVLVDFGLVVESEASSRGSQRGAVGTVAYMAPEQCVGQGRLTPAADWYAFGAVLYEALTGRKPFEGSSARVIVEKQSRAPRSPSSVATATPKDLDALCTALMVHDPAARPDGSSVLRQLGDETALVTAARTEVSVSRTGRARELGVLDRAFRAMLDLRCSAVVVRGESGMGKTTLIQHFLAAARVTCSDVVVLRGRCYERETVAYQAVDSLIDDLSHHLVQLPTADAASLLPREAGLLPRLFPVLGRVEAIATAPRVHVTADPQELRTRAFGALREVLQRMAERHPLVLILDDMHWVDASTVAVLADIIRRPDPPTLLLVLATRTTRDGSGSLVELLDHACVPHAEIELGPLSDADATTLAQELLGPEAHRASEVAREAAGNPLLLGELVKYVKSEAGTTIESLRLDDVIAKRVATLSPAAVRLLELAALYAEPISERTLASAAAVGEHELAMELATLGALHLLRSARSVDREVKLEPYHARVAEVMRARLSDDVKREQHRRLAVALTIHKDGASDRLALLWRAAGDAARASEQARLAADEAMSNLRFDRAAELLTLALELGSGGERTSVPMVRTMWRMLGLAHGSAGRPRDAATALLRAAEGAEDAERLDLRRRAADELLRGGYLEAGLALVREVLAEIHLRLAPTPLRALVSLLLLRAWLAVRGLDFRERPASKIAPEALTQIDVLWSVAVGLAVVDNIRGADGQARHLVRALAVGEPTRVARALAVEASFLASTGKARRARVLIARCRGLADRIGSAYAVAFSSFADGFVDYFCDSRWRVGLEHLTEAETLFRRKIGAGWEIDTSVMFSCLCQLYLGELDALATRVPALVQEAERRGDLYQQVSLRTRLNGIWLVADDTASAARDVDDALAAWPSEAFQVQHFFALGARCNAALYSGRAADADALLRKHRRSLERSLLPRVTMVRIEIADLWARIALAEGAASTSTGERSSHAARARRVARSLAREAVPVAGALATLIRAGAAALEGHRELAVTELRRALEALLASETMLHATAARARLGVMLGGDEGAELSRVAALWYASKGVRSPSRMNAMLAPAWPVAVAT